MKSNKSSQDGNIVIRFFSSVKLAIFLFIVLAITSIIGTVLPQGESLQFYLENYGPFWFKVIRTLHLYDTYHAWWYLTLMALFSINLIVCTIKRLPYTLRLFRKDGLNLSKDDILRRPFKNSWLVPQRTNPVDIKKEIKGLFYERAGKGRSKNVDGGELHFVEKGKWNYWGVYLIHVSVLVIFAGAIIGSFMGFKGRVMLLEGESTDHAIKTDAHGNIKKIPLGFEVKCEKFVVDFYPNGAPKLFKSDLVILNNGKEVLKKSILVNDPLTYQGVTFYQSSYQSVPDVKIKVVSSDGMQKIVHLSAFRDRETWKEKGLLIGMMKFLPKVHGAPAVRLYIGDIGGRDGDAIWLLSGHEREEKFGDLNLKLSLLEAQERYMTGLQVKKDPGVLVVWLGCFMMVAGFAIVFWVGHNRFWLWLGEDGKKLNVILAGQTNKNKVHFEKEFKKLSHEIQKRIGEA